MIEIAIMFYVGFTVNKLATQKGLSKGFVALALLIPVLGFIIATIAGIGLAAAGVDPDNLTLAMVPFALIAEGLAAWGIIAFVKGRAAAVAQYPQAGGAFPAPQYQPPMGAPVAPPSATDARMAGFCKDCGSNVWLNPDGGCVNGHPAGSVSNPYSVAGV